MSDHDKPSIVDSMLMIVLLELITELHAAKSIDADRLSERISTYADDKRLSDASLRELLAEIALLVKRR